MNRQSSRMVSALSVLALGWFTVAAATDSVSPSASAQAGANIDSFLGASFPSMLNAEGVAALHTEEGLLNSTRRRIHRMREIAARATSPTMSLPERAVAMIRFESLRQDVEYYAATVTAGGYFLGNGSIGGLNIQDQPGSSTYRPVAFIVVNANSLGLTSLDVSSIANATAALAPLDASENAVTAARIYIQSEIITLSH